jgi:hypothetical protein
MELGWALVQAGATLFPFVVAEIVILAIVWPLLADAFTGSTDKTETES